MNIKLISEDHPNGLTVDWPAVPGTGDWVSFHYRGGTTNLKVKRVEYDADADGNLTEVTVHLTY
ncbi:hypothetical protein [Rhizobium leguminosarum]|uniref:hypothetical protein n=1 Tax=Rhizobium leguminosarum TaxID=384 RepID=UPI00143F0631|nr:hypothetical protein [Rhizobium leguminosarum]NKL23471.1 hypothetical protein [Rhizobium leguminosarum bv. viciae]